MANLVNNYDGAEFFIFTGDTDISGASLEGIETGKWIFWNDHTRVWYATDRNISQEFTRQSAILKPDILFMIGMYSWHFTLVPLIYGVAAQKIISVRGMMHPGALHQKWRKKRFFYKAFKLFGFHRKVLFHATDREEKKYIQSVLGDEVRICVAGNFPSIIGQLPHPEKQPGSIKLVSIALISPMKNIHRVLHSLKNIQVKVEYDIYGAIKDEDYWQQCRQIIKEMPQNISVKYMQAITPARISERLSNYHVFILPSESENFGHAIFEALSAGRPVITSLNTPFQNLKENKAGINVDPYVPEDIADAVNAFLNMDDEEYGEWAFAATRYALAHFDKDRLVEEYDRMFQLR